MEKNFRIDWNKLQIVKKVSLLNLGINVGTKRVPVYDKNNVWVDTKPKEVIDFGGEESSILKMEMKNLQDEKDLLKELLAKKDIEYAQRIASMESSIAELREKIQSQSAANLPEEPVKHPLTDYPTGLEETPTTLYKQPPTKAKKGKEAELQRVYLSSLLEPALLKLLIGGKDDEITTSFRM